MRIPNWPVRPLTIYSRMFDLEKMSLGDMKSENEVRIHYRDARACAVHARFWIADMFGYGIETEFKGQDHDLIELRHGAPDRRIQVRCFVNGRVTFQRSKFLGYRRFTRPGDLERSVARVDAFALADFRVFPVMKVAQVPSEVIEAAVAAGIIKKYGLSALRLDKFLSENFDLNYEKIEVDPDERRAFRLFPHNTEEVTLRREALRQAAEVDGEEHTRIDK